MAKSNIKESFSNELEMVWNIVTSLENYSWRSDLSKIEVIKADEKFVEYTKDGYVTTFTITAIDTLKRWEFDMENDNMKGHWTGIFSYQDGITTVEFIEDAIAKKVIMKPFVGLYLKKQQKAYVADLKKRIREIVYMKIDGGSYD